MCWWVEPGHRGIGVRLYYALERWARARGAVALQMIAPTEAVAAIYRRLGYGAIETIYQKRLQP
jgi:GNAT superfamily N-acetyltransferase